MPSAHWAAPSRRETLTNLRSEGRLMLSGFMARSGSTAASSSPVMSPAATAFSQSELEMLYRGRRKQSSQRKPCSETEGPQLPSQRGAHVAGPGLSLAGQERGTGNPAGSGVPAPPRRRLRTEWVTWEPGALLQAAQRVPESHTQQSAGAGSPPRATGHSWPQAPRDPEPSRHQLLPTQSPCEGPRSRP